MNRLKYTAVMIYILSNMLCSCTKSITVHNHLEYLAELDKHENDIVKANKKEQLNFSAQYIPKEKYALQSSITQDGILDTLLYKNRIEEIGSKLVFSLKLSENNKGVLGDARYPDDLYYAKLQYFIDPAKYDIQLIQGKDTLLCGDYHFERYYDYAPYNTVLVTFDVKDNTITEDLTLQFNYPFINGNEALRDFEFDHSDINSLPKLNI